MVTNDLKVQRTSSGFSTMNFSQRHLLRPSSSMIGSPNGPITEADQGDLLEASSSAPDILPTGSRQGPFRGWLASFKAVQSNSAVLEARRWLGDDDGFG